MSRLPSTARLLWGALVLAAGLAGAQEQPMPDVPREPVPTASEAFWEFEVGAAPGVLAFGGAVTRVELGGVLRMELAAKLTPQLALVVAPELAVSLAPHSGWVFGHVGLGVRLSRLLPFSVSMGVGPTGYRVGATGGENGVAVFAHARGKLSASWGVHGGLAYAQFGGGSTQSVFLASVGLCWLPS